jgi:hypothetical protein
MFKKILSLTVIICFFLTTLGPIPQAHADSVDTLQSIYNQVDAAPMTADKAALAPIASIWPLVGLQAEHLAAV